MVIVSGRSLGLVKVACVGMALLAETGAARAVSDRILYSFENGSDGAHPGASLLNVDGTLYGTTAYGGSGNCDGGCGTVFSITPGGVETILHSFQGGNDGALPGGNLIDVAGTLYGTTYSGGVNGSGTVFSVVSPGTETVVYSFKGGRDGANPLAGLIKIGDKLYGTTSRGGAGRTCGATGCGTVFRLTSAGSHSVLYSFKGGKDGQYPEGDLLDMGGLLYGTTNRGGGSDWGTVFAVTKAGAEEVVYAFNGPVFKDGAYPAAGLINVGGKLYGTTEGGGRSSNCGLDGCGTVFELTQGGIETVIYSFDGIVDGANPQGNLIDVGGVLYGTTQAHGSTNSGTVFNLDIGRAAAGAETLLYSFQNGSDGANPCAALIDVGGTLYSTTESGGTGGNGTVFAISP